MMLLVMMAFLTGCQKQVNIGDLTLGQNKTEVIKTAKTIGCDFKERDDDINIADIFGKINLYGIMWDNATCEFKNDKLVSVTTLCPFEDISKNKIESVKSQLRELCGYGFNGETEDALHAGYGTELENNGCIGGIMITKYDDSFVVTIRFADYHP